MKFRVIELFAGVGGFRVGLSNSSDKFNFVWSNQWEPKTKTQHASDIYIKNYGSENHSNEDIGKILIKDIPEHDILTGGFPCQDYSVAKSLSNSSGLMGKKGVLWWEIHRILKDSIKKPEILLLENVDRLLKSPANQRGRDYAIMLASLSDLGYAVEWRVINAADYGYPQRRRRIFFLGYLKDSKIYTELLKKGLSDWIDNSGVLTKKFKSNSQTLHNEFEINGDLVEITENFNKNKKLSPFENAGVMLNRKVITVKKNANHTGNKTTLKDIILNEKVDDSFT